MIEAGIDTLSKYYKLTYSKTQNLIEKLLGCGHVYLIKSNKSNTNRTYFSDYFSRCGVLLYIYQRYESSGISFRVTPCTLLNGCYTSTELYRPTRRNYEKMMDILDGILEELELYPEISAEQLSTSRADPCVDLYFPSSAEVMEYLRILKKSLLLPGYHFDSFTEETKRVSDVQAANAHSYTIRAKSVAFSAYDKVFELEQAGYCPKKLRGTGILRLEVRPARSALLQRLHKKPDCSDYELLETAAADARRFVQKYLWKLQCSNGDHLCYRDAKKLIENSSVKPKMKLKMLSLLKDASDCRTLDTALKKQGFSLNQQEKILEKFEKLGVNPITLRNDSGFERLPSLLSLIEQEAEPIFERDADGFILLILRNAKK